GEKLHFSLSLVTQQALILLGFIRIISGFHVCSVFGGSVHNTAIHFRIASKEFWFEVLRKPKHIIDYQYLAITSVSGADTNGRNRKRFADFFGKLCWDFFQHNSKATYFLKSQCI